MSSIAFFVSNLFEEKSLEEQMKEYSKRVDAPEMQINIKFKNFQKMLYERREALRSGGNSNWNRHVKFSNVPAKINFEGKEYRAEISLKGSRKDHYSDSTRMSYQVNLKDGKTIMGMRKFSLHDPKMRNYIYEWVFHELLRQEGFISLKYDFIKVNVNGSNSGVYAIEERMDKILLERYGYSEGPIFKLADDLDSAFFNTIEVFNHKKYLFEPWKDITEKAYALSKNFQEGDYVLSKFVNTDMLAKYFAICDAFVFFHGSLVKSIRFYYNPITAKFEPIGFDGHLSETWPHMVSSESMQRLDYLRSYSAALSIFQKPIFFNEKKYDKDFLNKYVKYLRKYSSLRFQDEFFKNIADELTNKMAIIYKNHPLMADYINSFGPEEFKFTKDHFIARSNYIKDVLYFNRNVSRNRLAARINLLKITNNNIVVMVSNNYKLPIILKEVIVNEEKKLEPTEEHFLLPSLFVNERDYRSFNFHAGDIKIEEVNSAKLGIQIVGIDSVHYIDIDIYKGKIDSIMNDHIRKKENTDLFSDILSYDDSSSIIYFKKGKHTVSQFIKIPEGYEVFIKDGTEINLVDSAFILSYSPLHIKGKSENPVRITSDNTGGIAVFNCDSTSSIINVQFDGLSYPRSDEWKLTGAITFYKSPVIIENSEFRSNHSEDFLNIKHTFFKIFGSKFINVYSDAFDSDFSTGSISNTNFEKTGNDAIDVSGSKIKCSDIEIISAGDKAFSAGEKSELIVTDSKVRNSEIGFASKDNSNIECKRIDIFNSKLGFTAYQKKPEYGPAKISAEDVNMRGNKVETLTEIRSTIFLNGKLIEGDVEDVGDEFMYGVEFGKASER